MKSFETLGLSRGLAESVHHLGFEKPTPIQENAIPVLLEGNRDFVGLAQTGTGKTAAFGLPLIELCDPEPRETQALVLAPTRELCVQITGDLERFSGSYRKFNIVAVYGGSSISDQIKKIKKGAQIIVATPGRLIDLISRRAVRLDTIEYVVLDEADEMLNMGFKEDLDEILSHTPFDKKTWLFSATMPPEVRRIMKNYMTDPHELTIGEKNAGNVNIEHQFILIKEKDRYAVLKRLLDFHPDVFGLIFCRTRMDTQRVADQLMKDGYNADALHGDLTQQQRDKVMKSFREKTIRVLVATDVAARGIDVDDITHVIHMNIPDEIEFYTHRSGRTARAGKKGISVALATKGELGKIRQIEKMIRANITRVPIPSGAAICRRQLLSLMRRVHDVKVQETAMAEFLPEVYDALKDLSREEIIKRFASMEFNRFLDYYANIEDPDAGTETAREERYATGVRIFINLGKMDGLDRSGLIEVIDECCGLGKKDIGKIELKGAYSFFEVDPGKVNIVKEGFSDVTFRGRNVRVEVTGKKPNDSGKKRKNSKRGREFFGKQGKRKREAVGKW
ncbi:MAG: DEAD/DEAH box helicase [Cyclobacteriaceae bacterium]|nr:DEAD/DEAH box helicase [Cyclobacteriaceae bacterium]